MNVIDCFCFIVLIVSRYCFCSSAASPGGVIRIRRWHPNSDRKTKILKSKPPAAAVCGGPNVRAKIHTRGRALSRTMAARRPLAGRPLPTKSSALVARDCAVGAMLCASRCAHGWPIASQRPAQLLRRWLRTMLRGGRVIGARLCAVSGKTMRDVARDDDARWRGVARHRVPLPAAATPAKLRRCRDG
ncbi:translation initiation factor [Dorcoceras hygrometricum]|uniref:Translation initiation factor n=1 Tax=Dorcoceras hygrometricum TaxID=472368 RepID=A0A2Z7CZV2_9LAMI|nr:translation initiation factor [Dorcoceras hygrometricum]